MVEFLFILLPVLILIVLVVFFYYVPFFLWISARVSGVSISLIQLFLMRIRKVPAQTIVRAMIEAHKAGLSEVNRDDLEAHYQSRIRFLRPHERERCPHLHHPPTGGYWHAR